VPLDAIRPTTPILNRSSIKTKNLRRRQTIDTVQTQQHRTTLQQIQAIFWPTQETYNTVVANNQLNEHEQIPMIAKKRTSNIRRSSSARENNPTIINDNLNEQ
jgi:hypothetical protein